MDSVHVVFSISLKLEFALKVRVRDALHTLPFLQQKGEKIVLVLCSIFSLILLHNPTQVGL
jgi:hypothetical protein